MPTAIVPYASCLGDTLHDHTCICMTSAQLLQLLASSTCGSVADEGVVPCQLLLFRMLHASDTHCMHRHFVHDIGTAASAAR